MQPPIPTFSSACDLTNGFSLSSLTPSGSSFLHYVLEREIRPPTPRSEATVRAVTTGDIAELTATTFVAVSSCFAVVSNSWIQWRGNAAEREGLPHSFNKINKIRDLLPARLPCVYQCC